MGRHALVCRDCNHIDYDPARDLARLCCGSSPGHCDCADPGPYLCPVCWDDAKRAGEVTDGDVGTPETVTAMREKRGGEAE